MPLKTAFKPDLDLPITSLKGISEKRAVAYRRLGIQSLRDLLYHLPRAYEDWTTIQPIAQLTPGLEQTILGTIEHIGAVQRKGRLTWLKLELSDTSGRLSLTFFNMPWLRQKMQVGEQYYFHGKVEQRGFFKNLVNPLFLSQKEWAEQKLFPIYPLTEGLGQKLVRQNIKAVLSHEFLAPETLNDPLPKGLRQRYKLCDLGFALRRIHEPRQQKDLQIAKRRIAFEELFLTRAALKLLKERRLSREKAPSLTLGEAEKQSFQAFLKALPFTPTSAQVRATNEIFSDLKNKRPMNRLLQGDVGSGKTLVAVLAMLYTALAGSQALFMAPTSVLALQHFETLQELFAPTPFKLALLSGGLPKKQREQIKAELLSGELNFVVGTHAILQEDIVFKNLGLAITDEQHRFGVRQRSQVQGAEKQRLVPHRLVMSATPIPRTLALILYGDLDLSILDERPKGRGEILTYTVSTKDLSRAHELIKKELRQGRQVYVVCPLIEEGEQEAIEAASEIYETYRKGPFQAFRLALLHGSMKQEDKEQILVDFLAQRVDLLVATTVIEVGIDNPNATCMLILNAERFGLAQLHQLRGRIGRGSKTSYCLLHSDVKEGLARERLKTLCHEEDGFKIAEADLKLRGPGQFFGTKQHGLQEFKVANLYADRELMEEVEQAIQSEPLDDPALREALLRRYPDLEHGETL